MAWSLGRRVSTCPTASLKEGFVQGGFLLLLWVGPGARGGPAARLKVDTDRMESWAVGQWPAGPNAPP